MSLSSLFSRNKSKPGPSKVNYAKPSPGVKNYLVPLAAVTVVTVGGAKYYRISEPSLTQQPKTTLTLCQQNPTLKECNTQQTSANRGVASVPAERDNVLKEMEAEILKINQKSYALQTVLWNRARAFPECEDSSVGRSVAMEPISYRPSPEDLSKMNYAILQRELGSAKEIYYGRINRLQRAPECNDLLVNFGEADPIARPSVAANRPTAYDCARNPTLSGCSYYEGKK